MSAIHTQFVGRKHPWTSLDVQWQLDDVDTLAASHQSKGKRNDLRLFRFRPCGALTGFSGSAFHELVDRQQSRFLILAAVLAVVWLVFWFV